MTKRTSKIFAASALLSAVLPVIHANAAGFQVAEHSAAGLGRAFAGEAAVADDASVIARNPAGMSKIDRTTITAVGSYISPTVELSNNAGSTEGSKSVANEAFVPAGYIVLPYNDRWSFGFGANTNFGFTTNVSSNSSLTAQARESEIISMNLNASAAYKLNDRVSFGFGVNAVHTEAKLLRTAPMSIGGGPILDVEGDDWGFGWNAGMLFDLTPATRIGLSYRSEVKQTLEGKPDRGLFRGKATVDVELPAISELSVSHQLTDAFSLQASWQRNYWSSFQEIRIEMANGSNPPVEPQNWTDSNRYSLGMTWKYNNNLTLRAGVAKDETPISDDKDRYFSIPDSDRMWYTVGASYDINANNSVDVGYAYLKGESVDVYHNNAEKQGEITDSTAHIFSAQYNYRF